MLLNPKIPFTLQLYFYCFLNKLYHVKLPLIVYMHWKGAYQSQLISFQSLYLSLIMEQSKSTISLIFLRNNFGGFDTAFQPISLFPERHDSFSALKTALYTSFTLNYASSHKDPDRDNKTMKGLKNFLKPVHQNYFLFVA